MAAMQTTEAKGSTGTDRKRRDPVSGWVKVPVISNLNGKSGPEASEKAGYGGMFGVMDDDQEKIQVEMEKNQRIADRKIRIEKYNLSVSDKVGDEERSLDAGGSVKKVVSFGQFKEHSGNLTVTPATEAIFRDIPLDILPEETALSKPEVVRRLLALFAALIIFFFAMTAMDSQLAQLYLGSDNYSLSASVMKGLSASSTSGTSTTFPQGAKGDLIIEEMRAEMLRLRGCGDALFPSASTFRISNELFRNKKCANQKHRGLESIRSLEGINGIEETEKEVEKNWFESFISDSKNNGVTIRDDDVLSATIILPVHGSATVSSMLSWEFNCHPFRSKINNWRDEIPVKIFLDVRVNGRLLHFPGGNSIDIAVTNSSNPVSETIFGP